MSFVLEVKSAKSGRSVIFMKLNDVYQECSFLIEDEPQLHPLICLKDRCHRGLNCMEKLANRVKYIFDVWTSADVLLLYFSYRDFPKKQRAGIFTREMDEPRYITMNPHAWKKIKELCTVYEWRLPDSILLGGSGDKLHQIGKRD